MFQENLFSWKSIGEINLNSNFHTFYNFTYEKKKNQSQIETMLGLSFINFF